MLLTLEAAGGSEPRCNKLLFRPAIYSAVGDVVVTGRGGTC